MTFVGYEKFKGKDYAIFQVDRLNRRRAAVEDLTPAEKKLLPKEESKTAKK